MGTIRVEIPAVDVLPGMVVVIDRWGRWAVPPVTRTVEDVVHTPDGRAVLTFVEGATLLAGGPVTVLVSDTREGVTR